MGKPAKDVRVATQLIERTNGGMIFAETDQEVTRCTTILAG
jgi:TolB-like protein